jgi:hypothetical protein
MNNSATSPRAALVARARKHFIAIAATSVALTGGVTAYTAMSSAATQATSTGTGTGTSTKDTSSSGLVAPAANAPADGSSNSS